MCYNAPISFITLFVGLYIAYEIWNRPSEKAYKKNYDYWNALFIANFILIQLAEGLAWLDFDISRYLLLYIVAFQPIIQSFGNAYFNNQPLFYIPVIIGLLYIPFFRVIDKITKGVGGHLVWNVNHINKYLMILYGVYYFTYMSLPLLWQVPLQRYSILIVYGLLTLTWSLYNYNLSGEFTSMWCFLGIGYAFLAYIVNMKSPEKDQDHK